MISNEVMTEIFGYLALLTGVVAHCWRKPKLALYFLAVTSVFWSFHFFLLGSLAYIMTISNAVRNFTATQLEEKNLKWLIIASLAIAACILVPKIQHIYDVLPLLGVLSISSGILNKHDPSRFRAFIFTGEAIWLAYAIIIGSPAFMMGCLFVMGSLVVSIIRYDVMPKLQISSRLNFQR